jgi:hypothetical protein
MANANYKGVNHKQHIGRDHHQQQHRKWVPLTMESQATTGFTVSCRFAQSSSGQ